MTITLLLSRRSPSHRLLGLLVGSFLNVVIHRLPIMLEREWRRSTHASRGEPSTRLPKTLQPRGAPLPLPDTAVTPSPP